MWMPRAPRWRVREGHSMKQAQEDKLQQLLACRAQLVRQAVLNPRMPWHTATARPVWHEILPPGHEAVPDESECTKATVALVASPLRISRIDRPSGCYQDADGSVWFNSWQRGYSDPSEAGRCPLCRGPPSRGTANSLQLDPAKVTSSPTYGSTPKLDQVRALLNDPDSSDASWHSDGSLPAWLIMEFGSLDGVVVTEFTITNRGSHNYAHDSPLSLTLQGSNDHATWTHLKQVRTSCGL